MTITSTEPDVLPVVVPSGALQGRIPDDAVLIARGQYLLPRAGLPLWNQRREVALARILAVQRTCPSVVAFSHESAALLHGAFIRSEEPDVHTLHVTRPNRTHTALPRVTYGGARVWGRKRGLPPAPPDGSALWRSRKAVHRRHFRPLSKPPSLDTAYGLVVTSICQTVTDCLIDLSPQDAFVMCDSLLRITVSPDRFSPGAEADRLERTTARIEALLEREGSRPGTARARRLLPLLSPWSESPGESSTRLVLLEAGLPEPSLQHELTISGRPAFLDMAWPSIRLGLEFDGKLKYADADARYREKRRQEQAEDQGWSFVRVGFPDLQDPRRLVSRVMSRVPPGAVFPLTPRPWMS